MPNHTEKFLAPLPLEQVMMVCKEAVALISWRVLEQERNHLKCKEIATQSTSFTWPAEIALDLTADENGTVVVMNGGIAGWGPIQSSHLEGQMGNLRNRIEIGLRKLLESQKQVQTTTRGSSFVTELERLVSLREKGALTEQEFQQAKQKLLNSK